MASILKIAMRAPDDFHVHLREGELLKEVAGQTARIFKRALVMPNLSVMGPIIDGNLAEKYEAEILKATEGTGFKPLMTIKLTQGRAPMSSPSNAGQRLSWKATAEKLDRKAQ